MKKILIVNKSFDLGGIQSAMVNMANELSKYYQVDLFVYNPVGLMKKRLNKHVKIIDSSWRFKALGMSFKEAMKSRDIRIVSFRLFATAWSKLFDNRFPIDIACKHQKKLVGYDLAISYHQEQRKNSSTSGFARFVDRCVEATSKAAWLHYDTSTIDLDINYNMRFYEKMDRIVCVSKSLMERFKSQHPKILSKVEYCYNFMNYSEMKRKSEYTQAIPYPENKFICFSACRLAAEKALPRAIKAMADAFKGHPDILWYIAGDGPEKGIIESTIKENHLEGRIVLLGKQSNPYPYMKNADLLLNVSYHEAAPMVFFESKALGVPVLATKTSSAEELLDNGVDSFVCDNSEEGIRSLFAELIDNREVVVSAKKRLRDYRADNSESLEKIKYLMEFI